MKRLGRSEGDRSFIPINGVVMISLCSVDIGISISITGKNSNKEMSRSTALKDSGHLQKNVG